MAAGPANPALIPLPRSRARETARARRERRQRAEGRMIGQLVRATAAAAGSRAPASSLVRALRAALDAELQLQPRPRPHPPCEAPEGRDGAPACGAAPRARARHDGDGGRGRATGEHAVAPARGRGCTGSGRGGLSKNDGPQGNQVSCHVSECIPEIFYGVSWEGDITKGGRYQAVRGSVVVPELGLQPELFGESCGALVLPAYLMSTDDPSDAQAWDIHANLMSTVDPSDAQDGDDIKSAGRPILGLQPKPFGESCYGYRQGGIPTKNDGPQGDQDLCSLASGAKDIGYKMPGGMGMGRRLAGRSGTEGGGTHSRSVGMQSGQALSPSGYFGIEPGRAVRFADTETPMSSQ